MSHPRDLSRQRPSRCPQCGGDCLRHHTVEVFFRDEDAAEGSRVSASYGSVLIDSQQHANPSPRRDGVLLHLACEQCAAEVQLFVVQHKGQTFVGWDSTL